MGDTIFNDIRFISRLILIGIEQRSNNINLSQQIQRKTDIRLNNILND